jgi:prepilin-type N-terminal cleavage/methylation domain-containing protein
MKKKNFTLIELLVVIGIIGILLGILLPAVGSALREGKKTKVKAMVNQIAFACEAFEKDYQRYPLFSDDDIDLASRDFNDIRLTLNGIDETTNPRRKNYFDTMAPIATPWNTIYNIKFDTNGDGYVDTEIGRVNGGIAVWAVVEDNQVIKSWD